MQKIKFIPMEISTKSVRMAEILLSCILIINYFDYYFVFDLFFSVKGILSPQSSIKLNDILRFVPERLLSWNVMWESPFLIVIGIFISLYNIFKPNKYLYIIHFLILSLFYERYPHVFGPADLSLRLTVVWMYFLVQIQQSHFYHSIDKKVISIFWTIQVVIIYFLSTIEKLKFSEWSMHFNAIEKLAEIERHVSVALITLIKFFPGYLLSSFTMGVLVLEGVLIFGLFLSSQRIRNALVFLFISFHLSILFLMKVHIISYVAIVWWVTFLPHSLWGKMPKIFKVSFFKNNIDAQKQSKVSLLYPLYFLFVLVIFSFAANIKPEWGKYLKPATLARRLHIDQKWTMYSNPEMLARDQYIKIGLTLENGSKVDLLSKKPFNVWKDSFKENNLKAMFVINFYKYFIINKSKSTPNYVKLILQNAVLKDQRVKAVSLFFVENSSNVLNIKELYSLSVKDLK